jgi:ribonuclease-3 family protein
MVDKECDIKTFSPLSLAFIGDAVYELMVREKLLREGNRSVSKLNNEKVKLVRSHHQANCVRMLLESELTEEEKDVFLRGRNAHLTHIPKGSSIDDYHAATGFETLIGFLYMCNKRERLDYLFGKSMNVQED